ncbi:MAG TPA: hypothetical protein VM093_07455 [Aeromicrobium sp.]|nr:hypothetical protein [Aeromicrobium sp.]
MADRRRLVANLAAAGLLLALAAGVLSWQRPWATPGSIGDDTIPGNARSLLIRQFHQLTAAGTRAEFMAAAGTSDAARATARDIWDARRALGVKGARYAYERGGDAVDRADGTTSAQVDVSWRGGSSDVRFRLRPRDDGFDVLSAAPAGHDPLPVWLAGAVRVARSDGLSVITIDGGARDLDVTRLARTAVDRVQRVLPSAGGRLTVVVPKRPQTTAAVLGRRPRQVAHVAATSAALGGRGGKPAIVLNPAVFADMDGRAREIVMAHEATHVLTGVVGHPVELWVAEGFADYVALRDDRAPLDVSAGQILRKVKAQGPPADLPSAKDFDESAHGLGAAYEAAWLVFRMLGERFGETAVRDFYADVVRGTAVEAAAGRRFGLSVAGITSAWRAYLTKSASTVS